MSSVREALSQILYGAMGKFEESIVRRLDTMQELRKEPTRHPCGFVMYGLTINATNEKGDTHPSGHPYISHFIDGIIQLALPNTTFELTSMPQRMLRDLHFAAYGPCMIEEIVVGNTCASVWAGSVGTVGRYEETVRAGNRIRVRVKSWGWQ